VKEGQRPKILKTRNVSGKNPAKQKDLSQQLRETVDRVPTT